MSNIQIITDSTACIEKEFAEANGIGIVPLTIYFEGETFDEGYPGEFDAFYNRLKTSSDFPSTSQPSIKAFQTQFEKAINEGKEVIAILISGKLSGTYSNAYTVAQMIAPDKISVIDSETSASNLSFLTKLALQLANEGKSRQEIVDMINAQKKRVDIFFTVDTLNYLKKGGRLSNAEAIIGSILNIKPIIELTDGKLIAVGKARGKNNAIEILCSNIPDYVKRIDVCWIQNEEEALSLKIRLQEKYPQAAFSTSELGPIMGCHLGPKMIGILYSW